LINNEEIELEKPDKQNIQLSEENMKAVKEISTNFAELQRNNNQDKTLAEQLQVSKIDNLLKQFEENKFGDKEFNSLQEAYNTYSGQLAKLQKAKEEESVIKAEEIAKENAIKAIREEKEVAIRAKREARAAALKAALEEPRNEKKIELSDSNREAANKIKEDFQNISSADHINFMALHEGKKARIQQIDNLLKQFEENRFSDIEFRNLQEAYHAYSGKLIEPQGAEKEEVLNEVMEKNDTALNLESEKSREGPDIVEEETQEVKQLEEIYQNRNTESVEKDTMPEGRKFTNAMMTNRFKESIENFSKNLTNQIDELKNNKDTKSIGKADILSDLHKSFDSNLLKLQEANNRKESIKQPMEDLLKSVDTISEESGKQRGFLGKIWNNTIGKLIPQAAIHTKTQKELLEITKSLKHFGHEIQKDGCMLTAHNVEPEPLDLEHYKERAKKQERFSSVDNIKKKGKSESHVSSPEKRNSKVSSDKGRC